MFKRFFLFFTFLLLTFLGRSQSGWQEWKEIYSDENMTIELQLFLSDNSCEDDGILFKYRTRTSGRYKPRPYFVNWRMIFMDCNHQLAYQYLSAELWKTNGGMVDGLVYESLDNRFQASYILLAVDDIKASKTQRYDSGLMPKSFSIKPTSIDTVTVDGLTTLTAVGGYLGVEASLVWYKNKCDGIKVGKGKRIKVRPEQNTTYYVRAEGPEFKTQCTKITVIGTCDPGFTMEPYEEKCKTILADKIIAPRAQCPGDLAKLKIVGGKLEFGSVWVWYTSDNLSKRIGTGDSIYANPKVATTYMVRAEGEEDTTDFIEATIKVYEASAESFNIVYTGKATICEGDKLEMEVDNYVIDDDGLWNWYQDSCTGKIVASGAFVELYPSKTTTYFLKRDGTCNPYNCVSRTIYVNNKSTIAGAKIIRPDTVFRGDKTLLRVKGGILGKDAHWAWYKDSCVSYRLIGTGDSVSVKLFRKEKYLVRAEGPCYATECIVIKIKPFKSRFMTKILYKLKSTANKNR